MTASVPTPVPNPRPGRLMALGAVLVAGSLGLLVAAAVFATLADHAEASRRIEGADRALDSLGHILPSRVDVPGREEESLDAGRYELKVTTDSLVAGTETRDPDQDRVVVTGPVDGQRVDVPVAGGPAGRPGESVFTFEVPTDGVYDVEVRGAAGRAEVALVGGSDTTPVSSSSGEGLYRALAVLSVVGALTAFLTGVIFLAVGFATRPAPAAPRP